MNTKIILEGAWNIGKTSVKEMLCEQHGFEGISEPLHRAAGVADVDADAWYIAAHEANMKTLYEAKPEQGVVLERSVISSMAYLYASGKDYGAALKVYEQLMKWYSQNDSMVVVLYGDPARVAALQSGVDAGGAQGKADNTQFLKKLDEFYRMVLPFHHDITPLLVDVFTSEGGRKKSEEIIATIFAAIEENRVAQINGVCYRLESGIPKFLVLQRNERKGGFWQTITGGVHRMELLSENVVREVSEEIGIPAMPENLLATEYTFHYIGGEGYELNEYVYGYRLGDADAVRLSDEHVAYEFLGTQEAIARVKYDGNKKAIEEVGKKLGV